MKKLFAIVLTICALSSVLCVPAFAAEPANKLPAPAAGVVLRVSALQRDGVSALLIKDYDNFEDGWNEAMVHAKNSRANRIIVDIYADWNADKEGNFTDDWINGPGFDNDTIYIPDGARLTINLNGHTINRGLTEDRNDGEVIFINDDADVIINNGTITGGYSNSEGGGLYIEGGANVTLNNVNIVGNRIYNDDGAGIYMYGGSKLTVNGGSFENNTTDGNNQNRYYGGAVYVEESTAKFANVVFKNNQCKDDGAAIYSDEGKVTIEGCTIDGNNAQRSIIYAEESEFHVGSSNFINNNSYYLFDLDNTSLSIARSVFKNNDHSYIITTGYYNSIIIYGSTEFVDNNACVMYAAPYGVNMYSYFSHCTFNNNYRDKDHNDMSVGSFRGDFTNMVFSDCDLGNSNLNYAENVLVQYTNLSTEDVALGITLKHYSGLEEFFAYQRHDFGWDDAMKHIKSDQIKSVTIDLYADWNAKDGVFGTRDNGFSDGALYIPEGENVTVNLNGHTINRGLEEEWDDGEVIHIDENATVTINDGTIKGGYSDTGAGGIHINGGSTVTLNNVNVIENAVEGDDGAGIAVYDNATLIMNGGSISNCLLKYTLGLSGFTVDPYGALYVNNSTAILNNVIIDGNHTPTDYTQGVAIYATNSTVMMDKCLVSNNGLNGDDAESIIAAFNSDFIITNTDFTGNGIYSKYIKAPLFHFENSSLDLEGGKITGNTARTLFFFEDSDAEIKNVTVTDNDSVVMCVENHSKKVNMINCTLGNNSPVDNESEIQVKTQNTLTMTDCTLGDTTFENKGMVDGVGSIFGEGSLTTIFVIIALIDSVVSICMIVLYKKKNAVPATANNATEDEDEE